MRPAAPAPVCDEAAVPCWGVPDAQAIDWREWDGEHVVFDAATAATHLLDEAGGRVLRALLEARRPLGERELLVRLAGRATAPQDDATHLPALRDVLAALEHIGLARREAP